MAKCPFATQKPISGAVGSYTGGPFKIVHHTTEGPSAAGAFAAFENNRSDPHFTVDSATIYQHIDTNKAARSLRNASGGVQTNRDSAIQIEVVGFAGKAKSRATLLNVAKLCRWIEGEHGVPRDWPNGLPKPSTNGHDPGGHNRNAANWNSLGGHYGHSQVPENTHWDPAYTDAEVALLMGVEFDTGEAMMSVGIAEVFAQIPESEAELAAFESTMPDHAVVDSDSEPESESALLDEESAQPAGPHTPVNNFGSETAEAFAEQFQPSSAGDEDGASGAIDVDEESVARARMALTAEIGWVVPDTSKLADIGAASLVFGEPASSAEKPEFTTESVHGTDERIPITETSTFPWRVHASLLIIARDNSRWVGTAWFIGPRTLVTAGHCVYITHSGVPGRDGWVKSIQVMPGRNGDELPFGMVTATQFWSVEGWTDAGDQNYDYAAIIIPTDLGTRVGHLGIGLFSDATLQAAKANISGYPADKPGGTQWYDKRKIASVTPNKLFYEADTAGGQSGAAVYVIKGGDRIAVGVHAYGGATTNSGTRISAPVYTNLNHWKV
ncbi:N-acetylmuramoyl-L-alanine amidase [uncultured Lamprocystis sp.]|uniref:N-acetylmuramoyl-L-alanine amidase n=1 Tax=uncultured Lamprocystis sp. TaxID=543132 RepID=UPI0025EE478F|nr:N-acetylmuramoyl-L-alanine amidase [uncultured Lamprocystis sp.]